MAREYFCAYHSHLEAMEQLTDEECGRLFKACLEYSKNGRTQELKGNERFVFPSLRSQIDRDKKKYATESELRSESGKKGAQARWGKDATGKSQPEDDKNDECNLDDAENDKCQDSHSKNSTCHFANGKNSNSVLAMANMAKEKEREKENEEGSDREIQQPQEHTTRAREDAPNVISLRHLHYANWFSEFCKDVQSAGEFAAMLEMGRFTYPQLNAAMTLTQGKAERGKLKVPWEYLKAVLLDWEKRGLTERADIENSLRVDIDPGYVTENYYAIFAEGERVGAL